MLFNSVYHSKSTKNVKNSSSSRANTHLGRPISFRPAQLLLFRTFCQFLTFQILVLLSSLHMGTESRIFLSCANFVRFLYVLIRSNGCLTFLRVLSSFSEINHDIHRFMVDLYFLSSMVPFSLLVFRGDFLIERYGRILILWYSLLDLIYFCFWWEGQFLTCSYRFWELGENLIQHILMDCNIPFW